MLERSPQTAEVKAQAGDDVSGALDAIHDEWRSRIRARRLELELSQETLAERLNLRQARVSDIERGAQVPSDALKIRLATALETTVDALFSYTVAAGT